jgi:hypothetical protein
LALGAVAAAVHWFCFHSSTWFFAAPAELESLRQLSINTPSSLRDPDLKLAPPLG